MDDILDWTTSPPREGLGGKCLGAQRSIGGPEGPAINLFDTIFLIEWSCKKDRNMIALLAYSRTERRVFIQKVLTRKKGHMIFGGNYL